MNGYSLGHIWRRLQQHRKICMLIILEMAIATAAFHLFLTSSMDMHQRYSQLASQGESMPYTLQVIPVNTEPYQFVRNLDYVEWASHKPTPYEYRVDKHCPITIEDIQYIEEHFGQSIWFSVSLNRNIIYFNQEEGKTHTYKLLFVASNVPEYSDNIAYVGDLVPDAVLTAPDKNVMNRGELIFADYAPESRELHTFSGRKLDLSFREYSLNLGNSSSFSSFDWEQSVIVPLSVYYDFYHPKDVHAFQFEVVTRSPGHAVATLAPLLAYLNQAHEGTFSYKISNEASNYLRETEDARRSAAGITFVAILCMIVVSLGLLGLMLLTFSRRQKEFAVLIAFGATRLQLFRELAAEAVAVSATGGILGIGASYLISTKQWIQFSEYTVRFSFGWAWLAFTLSIIVGIASTIPVIRTISKFMPMEVLKE